MVDEGVLGEIHGYDVSRGALLPHSHGLRLDGVNLSGGDGVAEEYAGVGLGNDGPHAGGPQGDGGVLAGRAAAEVGASDDDRESGGLVAGLDEGDRIRIVREAD